MKRCFSVLFALLFCAASGSGQVNGGPATGGATFTGELRCSPPRAVSGAVLGAPYTAESSTENQKTLPDGARLTRKYLTERVYRDSQGRTRRERQMGRQYMAQAPVSPGPPEVVEIFDPVEGAQYCLDTAKKVAHRFALPPPPVRRGQSAGSRQQTGGTAPEPRIRPVQPPADPSRPQVTSESLGNQIIEGLLTEGRRVTTTRPVDFIGNDRPVVSTREYWTSPELKVVLLLKTSEPESGESVTRLANIERVEQDINLFRPPADYSVVDETDSITIKFTIAR